MAWKARDITSERREFVELASQGDANIRELCRRFGVSPKTGYEWIGRWRAREMAAARADRSRRPKSSPRGTAAPMEKAVVEFRDEHPAWGGPRDPPLP